MSNTPNDQEMDAAAKRCYDHMVKYGRQRFRLSEEAAKSRALSASRRLWGSATFHADGSFVTAAQELDAQQGLKQQGKAAAGEAIAEVPGIDVTRNQAEPSVETTKPRTLAFLMTTLNSAIIDRFRRQKRRPEAVLNFDVPARGREDMDSRIELDRLLASAGEYRAVVELYLQGMNPREIGERLGRGESSVRSQLERIKKRFRESRGLE